MTNEKFVQLALRTESASLSYQDPRILHAAMGLVTESGELLDALKKAMFYGRTLDVTNVREEAGDILWYLAILFDTLGTTFEKEQQRVIEKLRVRFPNTFTEEDAYERNLEEERKILEDGGSLVPRE